jgi:SP family sugar porter-like MFS transporter
MGNPEAARMVLEKIGGTEYAQQELQNMQLTLQNDKGGKISSSELKGKNIRPILIIGIVLAIFQQWCGINIIFNYAEEIFTAAGYSVGDMLFNIIITGSVNLIFTFVAMRTVDSWGRRKLMLLGSLGLAVVYAILGGAYFFEFTGLPVLVLVITAIAIYSMSLAPITWVVLSEIFPNRIRGVAMSIATFSLWVASFILTFTFPLLNDALGAYGTFWVYSGICVFGFWFIKNKLPETKGKSLEEIEMELTKEK